jgi:hypothetical protein
VAVMRASLQIAGIKKRSPEAALQKERSIRHRADRYRGLHNVKHVTMKFSPIVRDASVGVCRRREAIALKAARTTLSLYRSPEFQVHTTSVRHTFTMLTRALIKTGQLAAGRPVGQAVHAMVSDS